MLRSLSTTTTIWATALGLENQSHMVCDNRKVESQNRKEKKRHLLLFLAGVAVLGELDEVGLAGTSLGSRAHCCGRVCVCVCVVMVGMDE